MDKATLRGFVPFAASTVVIPAGMAALGIPWLVVFSVSLVITLCVAVAAYPEHRTWLLMAIIAAGAFAVWTVKTEQGYSVTWMFCRNQRYDIVDGEFRLFRYWIGVHPMNDNRFDLWMKSDEQTVILGGKSSAGILNEPPVRLPAHDPHFLMSTMIPFDPPRRLRDVSEGRIRYVVRYGRSPDKLDKTLIISGKITIEYPADGDTLISLTPDPDSTIPATGEFCRVPAI